MKKIKVMHVLCMNTYSGAENVAITLINSLKDTVDSVYVSPAGSICDVLKENNIKHYAIQKVSVPDIKKAVKDLGPDIIHAHDFTAGVVCSAVAGKIPVINHLHNNSPWLKKICPNTIIYALSCFKYKKILTVSDSVMDEFIFGNGFRHKTAVVGNPVNLSVIRDKAEYSIMDEAAQADMVFLGRLTQPKNPLFLLDIIKDLRQKKQDLRVFVIGDGELRDDFKARINEYALSDCVTMYGFQKNPYPYLKAAKVMCMPSQWEGFGLAAVEALALGKPVVAAPVGGLKDIINNSCGNLCDCKDDYVSAIYDLLTDYKLYETKSRGAVNRANEFDNIEAYRRTVLDAYEQTLFTVKRNSRYSK